MPRKKHDLSLDATEAKLLHVLLYSHIGGVGRFRKAAERLLRKVDAIDTSHLPSVRVTQENGGEFPPITPMLYLQDV